MKFEDHAAETLARLGDRFEHVHLWLDELFGQPPHFTRHRRFRHHLAGIEEVRRRWGDAAAQAARMHIESDLRAEGWTASDPFPKDERDYVRLGLW